MSLVSAKHAKVPLSDVKGSMNSSNTSKDTVTSSFQSKQKETYMLTLIEEPPHPPDV